MFCNITYFYSPDSSVDIPGGRGVYFTRLFIHPSCNARPEPVSLSENTVKEITYHQNMRIKPSDVVEISKPDRLRTKS
ncbi:hypothetical protein AHF37_10587 [Paragonimus kellicotti]|nr:hypothetical protein AHF37_10587 [Paragonimus kellicotti]